MVIIKYFGLDPHNSIIGLISLFSIKSLNANLKTLIKNAPLAALLVG